MGRSRGNEPQHEPGSGTAPLPDESPVRRTIRNGIGAQLASGLPASRVLVANWKIADAMAARCLGASRPSCAAGCAHCCHTRVGVGALEARALVEHLWSLPPERLAPLRRRIADNAARARGCDNATYPRMRCALLADDDRCSVYDRRPFPCRRGHSFDADACRRAKEGEPVTVPVDARVLGVYHEVAAAFREATAARGGDPHVYELHQALDALLDDADADLTPARSPTSDDDEAARRELGAAVSAAVRGRPG